MSGFKNDVVFAKNADFSQLNNISPDEANGLATDGQIWTGSTAVNVGGTHVNVGAMSSPNNSITFGYSSPNITAVVNTAVVRDLHISPIIVGPGISTGASYSSIQQAINDVKSTFGAHIIYVQPGLYVESLDFTGFAFACNIHIRGTPLHSESAIDGVSIVGNINPPTTGRIFFEDVNLVASTGDVFSSAAAGTTVIWLRNVNAQTTGGGYLFGLLNWASPGSCVLEGYRASGTGTANSLINNTGGCILEVLDSVFVATATGSSASISGVTTIRNSVIYCPINFVTGSSFNCVDSNFNATVTLSNNSTGIFEGCNFSTGATAALTMSTSASVSLLDSTISSSNSPSITGAGAGTLTVGDVTFLSNTAFASTVILASKGTFSRTPIYRDEGGSVTVRINSGSFATAAITLTTPPSTGLSDGELLEFVATNGVIVIQLASTQVAHVGSLTTSAAGTITSTLTGDTLCLRYQVSTNDWWATSVIGTWVIA